MVAVIEMHYKKIKELREDNDLKQSEIAKVLNITQANYSYIENGIAHLKADEVVKLCEFYNVSADYLLGFTDEFKPLPKK